MDGTRNERLQQAMQRFPKCDLFGWRLVKWLPRSCPMTRPDVAGALADLQDRGYERLAQNDFSNGNTALAQHDICSACWLKNGTNPTIQALRAAAVARAGQDWRTFVFPGTSPLEAWRVKSGFDVAQLLAEHVYDTDGDHIHDLTWAILETEKGRLPATHESLAPLWRKIGTEIRDQQTEWLRTRPHQPMVPTVTLPGRQGPRPSQPPTQKPTRSVDDIVHDLTIKRRRGRTQDAR